MSDELAIMVAATSDPEFKHRLAELRAAQADLANQHKIVQQAIEEHTALVRAAQEERRKSEDLLTQARAAETAADETLQKAANAQNLVRDEEARFEAGRTLVNQQQDARDKLLTDREAKCNEREMAIDEYLNRLAAREQAVSILETRHNAAKRHAAAFQAAINESS